MFSYVVARDFGFAPNPFFGVCTLATCKPKIRAAAEVGDWIIGTGSAERKRSGHVVYAMEVELSHTSPPSLNQKPSKNLSSSSLLSIGSNTTAPLSTLSSQPGTPSRSRTNSFDVGYSSGIDEPEASQYFLEIQSFGSDSCKLKLSRSIQDNPSYFKKLYSSTFKGEDLNTPFVNDDQVADPVLRFFRKASFSILKQGEHLTGYCWDIPSFAMLKSGIDGSVLLDQGNASPLPYDLILKTSGGLFIQSLHVAALTLQSPTTHLIGPVSADRLHTDFKVINDGGLQVNQITGLGTFTNHGVLKLVSASSNPITLSIREFFNKKDKKSLITPNIKGVSLHITGENRSF